MPFQMKVEVLAAVVVPDNGPYAGGNLVLVTNAAMAIGNGSDITNIVLGGVGTTNITGQGANWVRFVAPASSTAGLKDLVIQSTSVGGTTLAEAYTVNPAGWIMDQALADGGPYIAGGEWHLLGLKSDGTIVAWGDNAYGQIDVPAPNTNFVAMAGGYSHSLGVKSDGTIVGWGWNGYGQTSVPAPNTNFVAVAGGGYHSLGLKSDGTIVAWGFGDDGQTTVPAPNTNFVAVAGGIYHSLGLKSDGTIVGWGYNHAGQINVPAPNTNFVAVAGGGHHSLGLKSDGTIVGWGYNDYDQTTVPAPNTNFVAVAGGCYHSLGLKSDGTIVAWGDNNYGQTSVPAPNTNFVAVAGGGYHSMGLKSDGTIVVWGSYDSVPAPNTNFGVNAYGIEPSRGYFSGGFQVTLVGSNLGDGTDITNVTLCGVSVTNIASQSATQVVVWAGAAAGAVMGDVRVYSASFGETTKSNAFTYTASAIQVIGSAYAHVALGLVVTNVFTVTNAGTAALVITSATNDGAGAAYFDVSAIPDEVAPGTASNFPVVFSPAAVGTFNPTCYTVNNSTNPNYFFALSGNAYSLSVNRGPYAGGNTVTITNAHFGAITNVMVGGVAATIQSSGANWVVITLPAVGSAGAQDIVIQTSDNGDTTLAGAYTVNPPGSIADWVLAADGPCIAGGYDHSLGLKSNGTVATWGDNTYGQTNVPAPNTNFTAVAAGWSFSLGLKSDSSIVAWGRNNYGQTTVPAPNTNFVALAAGYSHSLGVKSDGTIVAWGRNDYGQANVPAPNTNFVAVAAGEAHSLGVKSDGTIVGWGWNNYGQLNVPAPNTNFVAVAAGGLFSLGLKSDGTIVGWGWNGYGQTTVPAPNTNFVAVAAGTLFSLGLKSDGTIVGWGYNTYGQTTVPAPNTNFVAVAAGANHSLGLKLDGTIVTWGNDTFGQSSVPAPNAGFGIFREGVSPSSGALAGGFCVTLGGLNLGNGTDITNVTLCGVSVTNIASQSATQVVVWAGAAGGAITGDVRVFSTSYGETVKSMAFTYTGVVDGAQILVTGPTFGSVPVGAMVTNVFTVTNAGNEALTITSATNDGTGAAYFAVAMPAQVEPGTASNFPVVFSPAAAGTFNPTCYTVNNSTNPNYYFGLYGRAYSLSTDSGPFAGGNTLVVTNGHFGAITNVTVGGVAATIQNSGANWVRITVPAVGSAGAKDIVIQTSDNGDTTLAGVYTVNSAGVIGMMADDWSRWQEVAGLPGGRARLAAASFNGGIYAIGGYYGTEPQTWVYRFDGTNWTEVAALPAARAELAACEFNGGLYAIGGTDDWDYRDTTYRYDGTNWTEVATLPWVLGSHAAGTLNGKMYTMGGFDGGVGKMVYEFDGSSWSWPDRDLPVYRMYLAAGTLNGRLYAIGGEDFDVYANVYAFDGTNWQGVANLPAARSGLSAGVLDGRLYAIGGRNSSALQKNVYRYDGTNWQEVAGLPATRCFHASAVLDGAIYAIGGYTTGSSDAQTNVFRYPARGLSGGVTPSSGSVTGGYPVVIVGSNLCNGTDITNVTLCGVAAAIQSQSATQIVVLAGVGSGSVTGDVRVCSTSFGETVKSNVFTYTVAAPVVGPVTLWRATNQVLKATDLMLLTNSVDPQGSAMTLTLVSAASTNGGTVVLTNHWVTYNPPVGNDTPDYFMFRVRNALGAQSDGTAQVIVITPATEGQTMNISSVTPSTSNTLVRFVGIPGRNYDVQSTTNLVETPWMKIGDITIGGMGYVIFTDTNEPAGQFYRTARPE